MVTGDAVEVGFWEITTEFNAIRSSFLGMWRGAHCYQFYRRRCPDAAWSGLYLHAGTVPIAVRAKGC
jgi:hypothetical protein